MCQQMTAGGPEIVPAHPAKFWAGQDPCLAESAQFVQGCWHQKPLALGSMDLAVLQTGAVPYYVHLNIPPMPEEREWTCSRMRLL